MPRLRLRNVAFCLAGFGLTVVGCTALGTRSIGPAEAANYTLEGYWQDFADPQYFLGFEGPLVTMPSGGQLRGVGRILSFAGSEFRFCQAGWLNVREINSDAAGLLVWRDPATGESRRLQRVASKPESLKLAPLSIPAPMPVSKETVLEVQKELWRRAEGKDSRAEARKASPDEILPWRTTAREPLTALTATDLERISSWNHNLAYLKSLVSNVGWIDTQRFGYGASNAAFFFVQHSWDPPLMMAALPWIQKDVQAGLTEGEDYALLYDRLQLVLGAKQRYGTQVGIDSTNTAFVFATEEPDQVDDRRTQLGMLPLAEYVQLVARFNRAYAPDHVVFAEDCAAK